MAVPDSHFWYRIIVSITILDYRP
uniref:Uncharacterized protein n=1 Tax=Anguilla anguilla TaxID=7936 RepID=A0A0E9TDH4_ANGAN